MRLHLLLLISFVISCTQSGGGLKKSSTGLSSVPPSGSTTGSDGGSSSTGTGTNISAVSMRYRSPSWPSDENASFYFIPGFADLSLKEYSRDLAASTTTSSTSAPMVPIKYVDTTNGRNFCFSNEEWKSDSGSRLYPSCIKAESSVVSHIKSVQNSNSGLHSVFISALQFNFKNAPEANGGNYSEVFFESAYIEKSKISFNSTTGNPVVVEKNGYNYGSGDCNIDDQDAVGFEVTDQSTNRFLLSGISSFERGKKKIFGEGTSENRTYEATECVDPSTGQGFLCNLIADKVSVWHSLLVPVIYKNITTNALRLGHRQFPSQVVSSGRLTGAKSAAVNSFGYYATSSSIGNVVTTPAFGAYDKDGNEIPDWQQSFITKFCIKGKRKEKTGWTPLIKAMHFELKSPRIKITN
ncbi:MAG: hypothetical protein R3A80_12550 [Bdellovibrionota bacterium]